jgi:hypothetical protein
MHFIKCTDLLSFANEANERVRDICDLCSAIDAWTADTTACEIDPCTSALEAGHFRPQVAKTPLVSKQTFTRW